MSGLQKIKLLQWREKEVDIRKRGIDGRTISSGERPTGQFWPGAVYRREEERTQSKKSLSGIEGSRLEGKATVTKRSKKNKKEGRVKERIVQ